MQLVRQMEKYADRNGGALATIALSVEPSLLHLLVQISWSVIESFVIKIERWESVKST